MDTPTPITPAGWYDDGHGRLRWWDGSRWTEHTAPMAPQQPIAPRPTPLVTPRAELVPVKRSKLVWILPLVMVLTALIGGLLGAIAAGTVSDTDPLEETYASFLLAERTRDCGLLEQVTTDGFRDDLVDDDLVDRYTCEKWQARPSMRRSEITWAMRIGPFGLLVAKERFANPHVGVTSATYNLVKQDGRWKLDDRESPDEY